ncbi:hypothetical protein O3P69_003564 [Scylla paramamosain]|uniref:Uncharacterized protein n=1 Tax=Scylla paramamosain TaxID=85552 RepID=A0AAW0UL81_SCYPA
MKLKTTTTTTYVPVEIKTPRELSAACKHSEASRRRCVVVLLVVCVCESEWLPARSQGKDGHKALSS